VQNDSYEYNKDDFILEYMIFQGGKVIRAKQMSELLDNLQVVKG
jgi:hypothetical protein